MRLLGSPGTQPWVSPRASVIEHSPLGRCAHQGVTDGGQGMASRHREVNCPLHDIFRRRRTMLTLSAQVSLLLRDRSRCSERSDRWDLASIRPFGFVKDLVVSKNRDGPLTKTSMDGETLERSPPFTQRFACRTRFGQFRNSWTESVLHRVLGRESCTNPQGCISRPLIWKIHMERGLF